MKSIDHQERCEFALSLAKKAGADEADAAVSIGRSTSVEVRLGQVTEVVQSEDQGLSIRILIRDAEGVKTATTSTSDLSDQAIRSLVEDAVTLARYTASDPFAGLPDADDPAYRPLPESPKDLDTWDPRILELSADDAIRMAQATEAAALSHDPRIKNSEGAHMAWGYAHLYVADSHGHGRADRGTSVSLWTTPIGEDAAGKQRDYWWSSARHFEDLDAPEQIGLRAAKRTLRRLGAKKPASAKVPVIFESPIASRLLGTISGAANGGAIFRNASWLCDKLGQPIASPLVTLRDNPWIVRGKGSRLYDGEGLATRPFTLVDAGELQTWILDTYSGRKLGLPSTRSAWRSGGSPSAGSSNLWMDNGEQSLEALIASTPRGLLVTDTVGGGANTVTGDFSQGVVGLWIENGELAYPVEEITIASTLSEMWRQVDGLANDRDPNRATSAPSFRLAEMTIAGA